MADPVQALGLIAGAMTSCALLPQVIKSLRTQSTKDIALGMFLLTSTGTFLWFVYGIMRRDIPLIMTNIVTFSFAIIIVILKIKYK